MEEPKREDELSREYPVREVTKPPHGNVKRGLPFYRLKVGEGFQVPPEDYGRTSSARAHFQTKNPGKVFSSRGVRDESGKIVAYVFRRDA